MFLLAAKAAKLLPVFRFRQVKGITCTSVELLVGLRLAGMEAELVMAVILLAAEGAQICEELVIL